MQNVCESPTKQVSLLFREEEWMQSREDCLLDFPSLDIIITKFKNKWKKGFCFKTNGIFVGETPLEVCCKMK
jgi:hypothetical protein